jgi:hypothetical protein
MDIRIAAILLVFVAGSAWAQAQQSPLDLQLPRPPDARADVSQDAATADDYGDPDSADTGVSVHGSFTAGVGYSKTYGNSTVNAAELDVSKRYEDGKTLDLHIGAMRSTGFPTVSPRGFGSRYPVIDRTYEKNRETYDEDSHPIGDTQSPRMPEVGDTQP